MSNEQKETVMSDREARKVVTLVEASYLMQNDVCGEVGSIQTSQQCDWLARSLAMRYHVTLDELRRIPDTPKAIRAAVIRGLL